jgi:hypothetical protein
VSRRLVAGIVALASFWPLPRVALAEPCEASSVMRRGAVAPCGGVLVPADRVAQCVEDYHAREAAEARLTGCRAEGAADRRACDAVTRALHEALEAERTAARNAAKPQAGTDWSAVAWGFAVGLAVGAGAVAGLVVALR